jgi:hypothetical protein
MESCGGDEKWKLSKKGRSRSGRTTVEAAAAGQGSSNTVLSRSYSASGVSSSRQQQQAGGTGASSSQSQSSSTAAGGGGLSKKCVEAVKEHRARFYIVRRCVSMLVCWRDH